MRSIAGAGLLLVAVLGAAGCKTEEPLELSSRNVELFFNAPAATVPVYRVYDVYEDSNDDDIPDGETTLYCENSGTTAAVQAPWPYSVRVRVLKNDGISPETVVRSDVYPPDFSLPEETNLGEYDQTDMGPGGNPLNPVAIAINGRCRLPPHNPCTPGVGTTCTTLNQGTCLAVGTCDGDSSVDCHVPPPGFPQDFSGCGATFAPCDCELLGAEFGIDLGFCCTPELVGGPVAPCNSLNVGRCTGNSTIGCQPGCGEQGAGVNCSGTPQPRIFKFGDPRLLAATNREVMASTGNVIADLDPGQAPTPNPPGGVCPGVDIGDPGIQALGQPYKLKLKKGEILLVEGRFYPVPPPGVVFNSGPSGINATLFVDGEQVTPQGSIRADPNDLSIAIKYTYQAR